MKNELYYFDHEVAAFLNITLNRLRNKVSAGDFLPPRIEPPGCRQRLWPQKQFHEWLEMHTVTTNQTNQVQNTKMHVFKPLSNGVTK